jgi:starch synthase/alpha-amylase
MDFFKLPETQKRRQVERIMQQSMASFNHANTARQYINLYEKMLERPLIN